MSEARSSDAPAAILSAGGVQITLDRETLRKLVDAVVEDVLARIGNDNRIAFPERDSADMLGVKKHILRDARLRGEINPARIGRGYFYTRRQLLEFAEGKRAAPK
jgi:hypothetical protein